MTAVPDRVCMRNSLVLYTAKLTVPTTFYKPHLRQPWCTCDHVQLPGVENLSQGTCKRHSARMSQDAVVLPEVDTIATGGKEEPEVMSPQSLGSAWGSPHIRAGWGHLSAGASSSNAGHSFEVHSEGASGVEEAASTADAGSVADASSAADGGEGGGGGLKEDGWEEVKRTATKSKGKVLHNKSKQGSRSNAGRFVNKGKSRLQLGNASNVLEVPRPTAK